MKYFFLLGMAFSILFTACLRRDTKDFAFGQDSALAFGLFHDVFAQIDHQAQKNATLKACPMANLVFTNGNFPALLKLDFGSACVGSDNRSRSGSINATFTNTWRTENTVVSVQVDSYYVEGYQLEGNIKITHTGLNNRGNPSYEFEVTNGRMIHPEGQVTQWTERTTVEWQSGQSTNYSSHGIDGITDDVYQLTGSGDGVHRAGRAFDFVVVDAVTQTYSCAWMNKGVIEVLPANGAKQEVDLGTGDCDQFVNLNLKSTFYRFIIP